MDDKYCFIVEKGINTSYISSILVAMFLKPSKISDMLMNDINNINMYYLQETIRVNFVDRIRNNCSIELSTINEIRNISFFLNWKQTDDPLTQFNINDFYTFITKNMSNTYIHYILNPDNISLETSINELIQNFEPVEKNIDFVSFYINRKNNRVIEIMKEVKIAGQKRNKKIHAVVCYSDRYYAIIKINDKWYLFDEQSLPSIVPLDIKIIKDRIQKFCVMLFYC